MRHLIVLFALLSTVVLGLGAAQAGAGGWDPDPKVQCENGADDDGDGWSDDYDPGCHGDAPFPWMDDNEYNPPPPPEWFLEGEIPGSGDGDPSPEEGSICRQKELKRSMSEVGPWGRRLFLLTTWCYQDGRITRSRSTVRTSHDLFCENTNPPTVAFTGAGGAGFAFVEIQANVEVVCASVPTNWPKYHDTLMMRIRYRANGTYQRVAYD